MKPNKKPIFETKYWFVILADEQTYLGYCIVVLKRKPCGDLADITEEELLDFFKLVKIFENALKQAFNATMFNWSCLMNNAYQTAPAEPHVHWHVRPRYNHVVEFVGETFEDPNFGHHYRLLEECHREVGSEIEEKIIEKIREKVSV